MRISVVKNKDLSDIEVMIDLTEETLFAARTSDRKDPFGEEIPLIRSLWFPADRPDGPSAA